jgi:hypothetical protein
MWPIIAGSRYRAEVSRVLRGWANVLDAERTDQREFSTRKVLISRARLESWGLEWFAVAAGSGLDRTSHPANPVCLPDSSLLGQQPVAVGFLVGVLVHPVSGWQAVCLRI